MEFINEFREFAVKGNVVDMAVGIIVGVAFNAVVQSMVNDVLMPPIGMLVGGEEFKNLALTLREAEALADGTIGREAVAIRYGAFVNAVVNFLIVAMSAFVIVKAMNRAIRHREAKAG